MNLKRRARGGLTLALALLAGTVSGCSGALDSSSDNITDVAHTDVERQSIGNCWLYAQASWVESMHLSANGEAFDISQSYWTYWHWFDQILGGWNDEISTGGNQWTSNGLVRDRGIMAELDFVSEDAAGEMSYTQKSALTKINKELAEGGRLETSEARRDGLLVRSVLDEAWGLSDDVRAQLDRVFGEDGSASIRHGASVEGTSIVDPSDFAASYTRKVGDSAEWIHTDLVAAIEDWSTASYPSGSWDGNLDTRRREFQQRVQRALHDRQPVVVTWDVDFNALENNAGDLQGSFNLTTLTNSGKPGRQGGHMTVFEDYEAETEQFGLLAAGVTLDPNSPADAAKLDAALLPSTRIVFFRIKNSWGSLRPDREFAPGYPGYHDLYMDYLNGPIKWCPDNDDASNESCTGTSSPLNSVMLPPGY